MSLAEFGLTFGLANGVTGIVGLLVSGTLADRLARVDPRWRLRVAAGSVAFSMPVLIAICAVPDPYLAVWLSVPSALIGAGYAPVIYAIAQSLSPPESRSLTASVMLLFAQRSARAALRRRITARRADRHARNDGARRGGAAARDAHLDGRSRASRETGEREGGRTVDLGIQIRARSSLPGLAGADYPIARARSVLARVEVGATERARRRAMAT
jgi:hypothetical protein